MKFNLRELKIINLLQTNTYTVNEMSELLNISSKTLKSDIEHINSSLIEYQSEVKVVNKVISFSSIYPVAHWKNIVRLNMTASEEDIILVRMLSKFEYIPMVDLASELYISKSKLEKIIATSPKLNKYIDKKRNVGIGSSADVDERIRICLEVLLPYVDDLNYLVTARAIVNQTTDDLITIEQFQTYISIFDKVLEQIDNLSDYECKIIILLIILSIHIYQKDEQYAIELISKYVNAKKADEDLNYIVELAIRTTFANNNINISNPKLLSFCVNHICSAMANVMSSTIDQEMELRVKTEFSFAYSIASQVLDSLTKSLNIDFLENEICYVAMYVQSLIRIDNVQKPFQVLIVCQYGMSVSNYIQVWIEQNIKLPIEFTISSILNYNNNINSNQYHLILTTIENLESHNKNIIYLSSIPVPSELEEAKLKIHKVYNERLIESFFDITNIHSVDIEQLDKIYDHIKNDFNGVSDSFIEAMRIRTDEGLTNVNGVIIMHSDGSTITNNKLLVYKLDNPVVVNDEDVRMIFVFAFTQDFIKQYNNIIKQIYKVLYLDQYVSALYETTTTDQFLWILKNQIRNK